MDKCDEGFILLSILKGLSLMYHGEELPEFSFSPSFATGLFWVIVVTRSFVTLGIMRDLA